MSRLSIGSVLALLSVVLAFATVNAQVPYMQAYFCPTYQYADCQGIGVEGELCVYTHNFHATYNTVEFAISYPAALTWVADHPIGTTVVIGSSPTGITLGWITPFLPAHVPSLIMRVTVRWTCDQCTQNYLESAVTIIPHPASGRIAYTDVATATIWDAVGMSSMICSTLHTPTEPTTWSKVKALYTE